MWGIDAAHSDTADAWVAFFGGLKLPAPPASVVCDDDLAVPAAFDPVVASPAPFRLSCEHHLRENAVKALKADGVGHWGSVRMSTLNNAFHSVTEWEAFCEPAQVRGHVRLDCPRRRRCVQPVRGPPQLPAHYSTSGAEVNLAKVRDAIRSRTFVLRNQVRTNKLLGLMRLRLNKYDDPVAYHHLMREHAQGHAGRGSPQAKNRDPQGEPSLRAAR